MSLAKCLGAARGAHALTPGLGTGSDDRQTEPAIGSAGLRPAASTRRMLRALRVRPTLLCLHSPSSLLVAVAQARSSRPTGDA